MIELELTPKIQEYLNTPAAERDIAAGAMLLFRVNRNRILYNNIIRNPKKKADILEYHLQKLLNARLFDSTHEKTRALMQRVEVIAEARGLNKSAERSEFQRGKRADHDELPDDVKKLYVDNAALMRRMRDLHTQLRMINDTNSTCPDSDRYPLCQAIIEYDTRYRDNWNLYDHYVKGTALEDTVKAVDSRTSAKNAVKLINLLLGKYAKQPTEAAANRINCHS